MVRVSGLLIIHPAEPFEILGVFGASSVPGAQTLLDSFELDLLLVRFSSFRVDLLHVLAQFLLVSLPFLLLELVVEFGLDLCHSSVLNFLTEKQAFQAAHLLVLLFDKGGVKVALKLVNLFLHNVAFSLETLATHFLLNLLLQICLRVQLVRCNLFYR